MARIHKVEYTDDFDGKPINSDDLVVLTFTVDGTEYTMDLREETAAEVRGILAAVTDRARKVSRPRRRTAPASAGVDRSRARAVRAWAAANGHKVAARGRIPADVQAAFDAAQGA